MLDALCFITSTIKVSNEFDYISMSYIQKTDQKQPKIVFSANNKTFEISKLVNCKSDINKTCLRYALPEHH